MDLFLNIDMQINNKFLGIGRPSIFLQEKSCEFIASFITAKGTRNGRNFRFKWFKPFAKRIFFWRCKLKHTMSVSLSMLFCCCHRFLECIFSPISCLYAQGLPIDIIAIDEIQVQACVLNRFYVRVCVCIVYCV